MSAAKLNIDWKQRDSADHFSPPIQEKQLIAKSGYVRLITKGPRSLRCPHCDSIIYSRRSKQCGVCAEPLPAALQFSPTEAARIERLIEFERLQHKRWMDRLRQW